MDIQAIIKQLRLYNPKKIIFFGSYASGEAGPDSDMDIAVVKNTSKSYHDRLIDLRRLIRTTTPIDFFVFTERELESGRNNPFIKEILAKGKVVYEQ